jgi:hypothetical protein
MLCICGHGLLTSMMQILLIVLLMVHGLHLMKRTAYTYNAGSDTYTKTITPTTSIAEPQL